MSNKLKSVVSTIFLIYGLCIEINVSALTLDEIRKLNPNYADIDDASLAHYLHKKYAPTESFDEFSKTISYEETDISSRTIKAQDTQANQSLPPEASKITQVETPENPQNKDKPLGKTEFNLHEFLKIFVAHMFFKVLFAAGIFQILNIGVNSHISSSHQQGRRMGSWFVVGSVVMADLTELDKGSYADFFGFFVLKAFSLWLMGYMIGYAWSRLKAYQANSRKISIGIDDSPELINDFNNAAKHAHINRSQKTIMLSISLVITLMLFFPPYQLIASNGVVYNMGYNWLITPPKKENITATVNIGMLLTQWIGVLIVGGILLFIAKTSNKNN